MKKESFTPLRLSSEKKTDIWVQFAVASVAGLSSVCYEHGGTISGKDIITLSEDMADNMTEIASNFYEVEQAITFKNLTEPAFEEIYEAGRIGAEKLKDLISLADAALDTAEAHLPDVESNRLAIQEIVAARKKILEASK